MNLGLVNTLFRSNPSLERGVTSTATSFLKILSPILNRLEDLIGINYRLCDNSEFVKLFDGKKIAVVGNGPNIVGKGQEIDSHDIVIRFNYGALPEFQDQENTGIKTDMMCFGAMQLFRTVEIEDCIKRSTASLLFNVGAPGKSSRPYFVLKRLVAYSKYMRYRPNAVIIPEELWGDMEQTLGGEIPTTGYTATMALLKFANFKSLSIYGFQFSSDNRILGRMTNSTHVFDRERHNLKEAIEGIQNIRFYE